MNITSSEETPLKKHELALEKLVVIGCSAGGIEALLTFFKAVPIRLNVAYVVVQHILKGTKSLPELIALNAPLPVLEIQEKMTIEPGHIYIAPSDYHALIERDFSFSLVYDEKVNYSRPSIDVLFESAADACRDQLIAILMTGASKDGAQGMYMIKELGGITIAQDLQEAEVPVMPRSAIQLGVVDYILPIAHMPNKLSELMKESTE